MIAAQLALPLEESPLLLPAGKAPPGWEGAEAWRQQLEASVRDHIRPALARHLEVVRGELVPAARRGTEVGVHALPGGEECYAALARYHTTLPATPDELHELGLAELTKIHEEFRTIGGRVFETSDLAEIFERLRTEPELRFETAEQVRQTAEDALARAVDAVPRWFGRLPVAECVVEPIPDYLAPYTTIAYYQPARPDGSRPGTYFINVYEPQTRPRHEAEVLAFHESVPGHHFQIAIAQELGDLPAFRRHGHVTAFVEGLGALHRATGRRDGAVQRRRRPSGHAFVRCVAGVSVGGGHGDPCERVEPGAGRSLHASEYAPWQPTTSPTRSIGT